MPDSPSATQEPTVACILVNWNNWQDTSECLASLARQDYPALCVMVVDNGSTNDSLSQLRTAHPWATYIENGYNAGFPKACNVGARHPCAVSADFVWLLNNDTIAPPDTTRKLLAAALANPEAAVIGAVLYYADGPSRIQAWGGGRISLWTGYNTHYAGPTALAANSYITFASALIRRPVFDRLGGLFEGAFMYFEDPDFCLRARAAGWQLAVAADTSILHKEGASFKASGPQQGRTRNLRLERLVTLSGLVFLSRHAAIPAIACPLFFLARVAKRIVYTDWAAIKAVVAGALDWRQNKIPDLP
jgi:GT2 family glycosyltransferase